MTETPTQYLAAIGARGGLRGTPAQRAQRMKAIAVANRRKKDKAKSLRKQQRDSRRRNRA